MNYWIIADTHFNHKRMCELEGRPEDFTEQIIANWQRLVRQEDTVIHLGDVILGQNSKLPTIMARLPGKKILTLGNHDVQKPQWYMKRGFDFVAWDFSIGDVLFSHEPTLPLPYSSRYNLHGHFHRKPVVINETDPWGYFEKGERLDYFVTHRSAYILVQIEDSLSPIPLEHIVTVTTPYVYAPL